ncbi:MAG: cytochrome P450 [Vulcanimicrobiaceae bacterium]
MNDLNPLAAVRAVEPYPYYARLVADRPFHRDETLGMWVAAGAQAVEAVLSSTVMRVRPASEPVPKAIAGTPMAGVFARLVRMTDGDHQVTVKDAAVAAFDPPAIADLAAVSERCADMLLQGVSVDDPEGLATFVFSLSPVVIATALGLSLDDARQAAAWTRDFVRSVTPGSSGEEVARGIPATGALIAALRAVLAKPQPGGSLFGTFVDEGRRRRVDDADIIANALGFLSQGYDATAGLIGNTLVALANNASELRGSVGEDANLLECVVAEVARYDAPVQNTRRFAAADTTVLGEKVQDGDAVVVVFAAANRDPWANPDPDRFDLNRKDRRTYTFGMGSHACPGARVATTIARTGVSRLLASGINLQAFAAPRYRPSLNARIPDFASAYDSVGDRT